jgi:hypothetical protein
MRVGFSRLLDRRLKSTFNLRDLNTRNTHPNSLPFIRSGITPPITRPQASLLMRASLMRVGWIGLFGRDATSPRRGARDTHHAQPATRHGELNHAPLARRNYFLS